jgi:hypothetical protein
MTKNTSSALSFPRKRESIIISFSLFHSAQYEGVFTLTPSGFGTKINTFQIFSCGNNIYNTNSGNVGIGTNNPLEKLNVFSLSNPSLIITASSNRSAQLGVASSSGAYSNFATTGDIVLRTQGSGSGDIVITARATSH